MFVISSAFALINKLIIVELKFLELISFIPVIFSSIVSLDSSGLL